MAKYPSPLVSGSPNYGVGEQAMNIKVLIQAYQTTKLTSQPTQQGGFINKLDLILSKIEENKTHYFTGFNLDNLDKICQTQN